MQYSITAAIVFALGSNIAHCGPLIVRQFNPPTLQDIADAQNQWASDTSKVSQFLSAAESLNSGDLVSQAATALANEKDELNHKAVLDNQFVFVSNPDENVQQANNVLVDQGTFMVVLNGLQGLVDNGANMSPSDVSAAIQSINVDRCSLVLPSIDTYFQASEIFSITVSLSSPTDLITAHNKSIKIEGLCGRLAIEIGMGLDYLLA